MLLVRRRAAVMLLCSGCHNLADNVNDCVNSVSGRLFVDKYMAAAIKGRVDIYHIYHVIYSDNVQDYHSSNIIIRVAIGPV